MFEQPAPPMATSAHFPSPARISIVSISLIASGRDRK
jgi:hypothetical protein